jgi:hypothetical protein
VRSRLQTDRQTTGGQTTDTERRERASQQRAAGAAGRRGEDGERQARAGVQASGYANARKYWAAWNCTWGSRPSSPCSRQKEGVSLIAVCHLLLLLFGKCISRCLWFTKSVFYNRECVCVFLSNHAAIPPGTWYCHICTSRETTSLPPTVLPFKTR